MSKPTITAALTAAALALAALAPAAATAEFGFQDVNDGAGPAPEAPAFPGTEAVWSGTCDLTSASTENGGVGLAPAVRPHCIEHLNPNVGPTSWRLDPATQAGGHPDATASLHLQASEGAAPVNPGAEPNPLDENVKDVVVRLPPGVVGSPTAGPQCAAVLAQFTPPLCGPESQVGMASLSIGGFTGHERRPVYNVEARDTVTAEFAIGNVNTVFNVPITARGRTNGDYGVDTLSLLIPTVRIFAGTTLTLWGVPWATEHDKWRQKEPTGASMPAGGLPEENQAPYDPAWGPIEPFFSNPTRCTASPLSVGFDVDSWHNPGRMLPGPDRGVPDFSDPNWKTSNVESPLVTGCEKLAFDPSIELRPTVKVADTPAGLDVTLETPQNDALPFDPPPEGAPPGEIDEYVEEATDYWKSDAGLATAHLKDTVVELPEGTTFNPAAANGIEGCTTGEIGLTQIEPTLFNNDKARCPDASTIGTLRIDTPLLPDPLEGFVYVAKQGDNPYPDALTAIYLVAQDEERGLSVKLAGKVQVDPVTGQISTTFVDNPQLPFDRFVLRFEDGDGAALATPAVCGQYRTAATLTPWSAPDSGAPAVVEDPFDVDAAPNGFPCAGQPQDRGFAPGFAAGTTSVQAGGPTNFALDVTRRDGEQEISGISLAMPPGLLADISQTPHCPDGSIAAAAGRSGLAETNGASCPAASYVGSVNALAGAGGKPLPTPGKLYLSGPYDADGAGPKPLSPLSVTAIVPAIAGGPPGEPVFDLGNVVIRTGIDIDPRTATVNIDSTRVPYIVGGVPLRVKRVLAALDKPGFTINPTNCSQLAVWGGIGGASDPFNPADDILASVHNRFQVGNCEALGSKPRLRLRLRGATRRTGHPRLIATLWGRPGDANIARTSVQMPRSEFLDQAHIRTVCTRVQFAAGACPRGAIYGYAEATTPILANPVRGPVYLRSSSNTLPDLVADLRGPADQPIRVELVGRTDSVKGALRNTFDVVPDAPVSKFTLRLQGGHKGLLINSRDICARKYRATVRLAAQNGRRRTLRPKLRNDCGKKKRRKASRSSHRRASGR